VLEWQQTVACRVSRWLEQGRCADYATDRPSLVGSDCVWSLTTRHETTRVTRRWLTDACTHRLSCCWSISFAAVTHCVSTTSAVTAACTHHTSRLLLLLLATHRLPPPCAYNTATGSMLRRVQSDVTELNWTNTWNRLVFDELTSGQTVMHYSRHCLTASVTTWLRSRTRQPMTNRLALLAHWSLSQKYKPCQFGSVTSLCTCLQGLELETKQKLRNACLKLSKIACEFLV